MSTRTSILFWAALVLLGVVIGLAWHWWLGSLLSGFASLFGWGLVRSSDNGGDDDTPKPASYDQPPAEYTRPDTDILEIFDKIDRAKDSAVGDAASDAGVDRDTVSEGVSWADDHR